MNLILLLLSLVMIACILCNKLTSKIGIPMLLAFLAVGMLCGVDGILHIRFDNYAMTETLCTVALIFIIFYGGFGTKWSAAKPVAGKSVLLSTLGVFLTAFGVGVFCRFALHTSWMEGILMGAVLGSTDAASVFSILRSKKLNLKYGTASLLEVESGSNDPMAYILTILLVGLLTPGESMGFGTSLLLFVVGMTLGVVAGNAFGRLAVWTINRINLANHSLYSVLLLAFIFFSFAFTDLIKGNGYLAVYLSGLVVGNYKLQQKRPLTVFFDGFTWLMQIVMFLTLGLFVNSDELLEPRVLILGGLVGAFMILVARPLTVFICMAPFRKFTAKARLYVSWVGLRGAVPILFAIYPLMAHVENAGLLFNVVFLGTIISLLVQGTTVSGMANLLGLAYEERESAFSVDMHQDMKSALTEVEVNETMLESGHMLKDITLPENTLVMMVCRNGEYFVPQGKTELLLGDKLLVISDRSEELATTYKDMGIDDVMKLG